MIVDFIAAAAGQTSDLTGELWIVGGIVLTAMLGWIGTVIVKRIREPMRIETMWTRIDALTTIIHGDPNDVAKPGLVARVDDAERKAGAAGRVIRDLARQWPEQHSPRLNPYDLAELDEDTIPTNHPWRTRP